MILETWLIFTLLVMLLSGAMAFVNKIIVEEKFDRNLCIFIFFIVTFFVSLFGLIFFENGEISLLIIAYGIIWGIVDYFFMKARFMALGGISSSLFFINYRLFSSSALLLIGIFIFGDAITLNELIGFLTGFVVFGLLFEKEKIKNDNYIKGLIGLTVCIFMIVFLHIGLKWIGSILMSMDNFSFYLSMVLLPYSIVGMLLTYITNHKIINFRVDQIGVIIGINVLQVFIWIFYTIFLIQAYELANIGIIYKILSYSIFIPIFLSVLIYKEKLTLKKIIAFVLTMVSLWFFI